MESFMVKTTHWNCQLTKNKELPLIDNNKSHIDNLNYTFLFINTFKLDVDRSLNWSKKSQVKMRQHES
jgi:hypothetical protein